MSEEITTELIDPPAVFGEVQKWELAQRKANAYSSSQLVPKEYQGKSGIPNCLIAMDMAERLGASPLMVMQNLDIIHGRPSWRAQFLISTFNACGRFSPIRYRMTGTKGTESYGCIASAVDISTGELLEGTEITVGLANAEGWSTKPGSKWKTMPEQMLKYRAAAWFVRTYAPELSMGLHTVEESQDIVEGEVVKKSLPKIGGDE